MIGLALVTFVAVLAQRAARARTATRSSDQIQSDYVVTSQDGYSDSRPPPATRPPRRRGVEAVEQRRARTSREVDGDGANLTGLDRPRSPRSTTSDWKEGSDDGARRSSAPTARSSPTNFADDKDLARRRHRSPCASHGRTSDGLRRPRASTSRSPFYPLLGTASISQDAFDELYERPRNLFTFLNVAGGRRRRHEGERRERARRTSRTREVQTRDGVDRQGGSRSSSQFLLLLYVLLALSVIVSLFGMVNTLVLSVFERTRELGMLRAVGMTRRQTRRMIRHESVITALIGAALGLPLGIFLAALVTRRSASSTSASSCRSTS